VIRVATRGSALALAQARAVADGLVAGGARVEVIAIRTEGDRRAEARLATIGGKGLFVREIEQALLRGEADVAVHSLKDLPAEVPPGLTLAVYPEREDPRDVLITREPGGLDELPRGAVVGTSSPRRRALVLALRADLVVTPIRGNVDTRLAKLATGDWSECCSPQPVCDVSAWRRAMRRHWLPRCSYRRSGRACWPCRSAPTTPRHSPRCGRSTTRRLASAQWPSAPSSRASVPPASRRWRRTRATRTDAS